MRSQRDYFDSFRSVKGTSDSDCNKKCIYSGIEMDKSPQHSEEMSKPSEPPSTEVFDSPTKSICLSAALENLPLVYLPQTKQLVTAPWHQSPNSVHSTTSSSHARSSCSDIPEFHFTDDISGAKSLAGSKISEDSGYPELWDSDVSLSRELHSERNSSIGSGDLLDCDLTEGDESSGQTEICSSDGPNDVTLTGLHLSEPPDDSSGFSNVTKNSCSSVLVVSDSEGSGTSNDCTAEGVSTSLPSPSEIQRDICDSGVASSSQMLRTKRGMLANLFTSSWFSSRAKNQQDKVLCRESVAENAASQNQEPAKLSSPSISQVVKKGDFEKSTTALILQDRPRGLPTKDPEEEARHRYLYQVMVEEAKQKERKDAKRQKQKLKHQLKLEAATASAFKTWSNEIIPNWEAMKNSKKARDLWWSGIPPRIRGRVWQLAIGNELNITAELYEICLIRAKERLRILKDTGSDSDSLSSFTESTMSRESSVELIRLDVSRTFPNLCIFQKGGPYHDMLQGLLGSYACYRPDVGYVQGMSFIGATLLLNMEPADAFISFANLLNKPCLLAFFRLDRSLMDAYFETFDVFFKENLPCLHQHMHERNVTPDLYLLDWLFTLYAKSLSLDIVSRVWDVYFRDGEEFLFQTALGILKMYEDVLLNLDFIQLAQFLTRLPSDISYDDLFTCIAAVSMEINKQQFEQILSQRRDLRTT